MLIISKLKSNISTHVLSLAFLFVLPLVSIPFHSFTFIYVVVLAVACRYGRLYNREAVIEFLLGAGQFKYHKQQYQGLLKVLNDKNFTHTHISLTVREESSS
jgi:hypothetical protein